MANYKKITSLSLLTLLSLATFSATQYSKVYAQDPESSSSVNIKTIDGQLAIADKEAEPLYKEMDSIQMNIEKIKASRFKPAEIAITTNKSITFIGDMFFLAINHQQNTIKIAVSKPG